MGRAGSPAKKFDAPTIPASVSHRGSWRRRKRGGWCNRRRSMAGSCRDRLSHRTGSHAYCCLDPPHGGCLGCVEKETNLRRRYCVNASRPTRLDIIAAIGLAVGAAFGLAGTFVAQPAVHQVLSGHRRRGPSRGDRLVDAEVFPQGRRLPSSGFPGIRQVLMDVGRSIRTTC